MAFKELMASKLLSCKQESEKKGQWILPVYDDLIGTPGCDLNLTKNLLSSLIQPIQFIYCLDEMDREPV